MSLTTKSCQPCEGKAAALTAQQLAQLALELPQWRVANGELVREVQVKDFAAALALVNRAGALAETENHHPDILIYSWNRVRFTLSTHSVGGLTENDFIMAAKLSTLL